MQEVDRYGVGKVMEMALDHVCCRVDRPLHFSLDIDSVDPAWAPSTGTVVRGGLNYREVTLLPALPFFFYFILEGSSERLTATLWVLQM